MRHSQPEPRSGDQSPAWYAAEGARGDRLLAQGLVSEATEVFQTILARLGGAPSYGRALILGRLGRCLQAGEQSDAAVRRMREAIDVIGRVAPGDGVKRLRGTLRSDLGNALRASGRHAEARKAYEAALRIAEDLKDLRAQAVEQGRLGALSFLEGKLEEALSWHRAALRLFGQLGEPAMEAAARYQLARVYHQQQRWDDAEADYRAASRINEELGHVAAASQTWSQLAACMQDAGKPIAAEECYRAALALDRRTNDAAQTGRRLASLANLLQSQPGRLDEARQLATESLAAAQSADPAAAWEHYGLLAEIIERGAQAAPDGEQRSALEAQAHVYRELQRRAPVVSATLSRLTTPEGRAILLGQLGRCFQAGSRPDLAVGCYEESISLTLVAPAVDALHALRGTFYSELGDVLRALARDGEAREAYVASLEIAQQRQDLHGQVHASQRLGAILQAPAHGPGPADFDITCSVESVTDFVFGDDLLVDGPHERRLLHWNDHADSLGDDVRPVLTPCARAWLDDDGSIRFGLPPEEPIAEAHPECTVLRRVRREVSVVGEAGVVWRLVSAMDGTKTALEILSGFSADRRALASRMLAALASTGVVDSSNRAVGRFLHQATRKGVLPAGGLEGDAVLQLATDGHYREYPGSSRLYVSQSIPDPLRAFHALTRTRRSSRTCNSLDLSRHTFDALLHTACGVTGAMPWAGREVKLRAYPSSGALYAVEIYPVVLRVQGVDPGVYHYRATENALEVVRPISLSTIVEAALPVERAMVAGASVLFCLTGCFARHERKYGEGGYRMLVAEAGHISQNLILAATAMSLNARPFGGVFDALLNRVLGLAADEEQFLLAVLVGREQ